MKSSQSIIAMVGTLTQKLKDHYKDLILAQQYAWWTLEAITQKTRNQLLSNKTIQLTSEQEALVDIWIQKLTQEHMPIQYLIGTVPFCDLIITVQPPLLIPRPETEQWCAELIEKLHRHASTVPLRILDLCSGTGCIGLSLAKQLPRAQVVCVDISVQAIELGRLNAHRNNINTVTFIQSDLFENLEDIDFDLIVSNPPYISETEFTQLDASVADWEDKNALVAADNGYAIIRRIITQAPQFIRSNDVLQTVHIPQLVLEHGAAQSTFIVDLMHNTGYTHVQTHKDLSDRDRVVSGRLADVVPTKKTV